MPKIVIAMPAFNEGVYIGTVVLKAKQYGDEVIVVNDGSADDTEKVARLAGAAVINNGRNMGTGATVQRILAAARVRSLDVLVMLDSDAQHNPDDIPTLVNAVLEGYDLVIGSRRNKDIPLYRLIGGKILNYLTHVLAGQNVSDAQSGFRALSPKAVRELEMNESGMSWASEMVSEATKKGLKIIEVPISIRYIKGSSTMNPIHLGGSILTRVVVMISKRRPLLFFGGAGGISVVAGLLLGAEGYRLLQQNSVLPVGIMLVSVSLTIVGVLSVFVGIILNALRK